MLGIKTIKQVYPQKKPKCDDPALSNPQIHNKKVTKQLKKEELKSDRIGLKVFKKGDVYPCDVCKTMRKVANLYVNKRSQIVCAEGCGNP